MADEKKEQQQDQETIKPAQGDNEELSEKDLEKPSGGAHAGPTTSFSNWIDIQKI